MPAKAGIQVRPSSELPLANCVRRGLPE